MSVTDLPVRPADATMGPTTTGSSLPAAERAAVIFSPHPAKRRLAIPGPMKGYVSAGTLHIVLGALAFVMMAPFVWMVLTSLKSGDEIDNPNWLPHNKVFVAADGSKSVRPDFQWSNYKTVFDKPTPERPKAKGVDFGRFYWNSIFVAAWITFLQVMTSAMAAFSFARLKWPGRDKVFLMYLSTMMLPGLVMTIPNFQIMTKLHLVDTLPGLIIPAAFSAFGTFLLRQFMLTIPSSLDEAAEIDGASKLRLFFDIILPLSRPGLITLTIFTFMGAYNSLFWPIVMIASQSRFTLPIGLSYFDTVNGDSTHLLMAAVTMSVLPMIVLFLFLQRYLVKGIQLGAVKG
jgi:ABC-type glycerol-3-phosphate transport system permease component